MGEEGSVGVTLLSGERLSRGGAKGAKNAVLDSKVSVGLCAPRDDQRSVGKGSRKDFFNCVCCAAKVVRAPESWPEKPKEKAFMQTGSYKRKKLFPFGLFSAFSALLHSQLDPPNSLPHVTAVK